MFGVRKLESLCYLACTAS